MNRFIRIRLVISFICAAHSVSIFSHAPQLTLIFVVDQFAAHYFSKLERFFQYSLKDFTQNGIVYTNAYHPHGTPATATGHTALSTGTFAHRHGIVNNEWLNGEGQSIPADNDPSPDAAVFSPNGVYDYGRSAHNIVVDSLSDQIMLHNDGNHPTHVFTISLKSRAAICMAGKLGTALWFDPRSRTFTTSKAYASEIPHWVQEYNNRSKLNTIKKINWKPRYPLNSRAYQFKYARNYEFAGLPSLIGKTIPTPLATDQYKDPLELNPIGNQICLDLAAHCIKTHLPKKSNNALVLWISLSSLDLIGHQFGPDCIETIDMIYQLDKQLKQFMNRIEKYVDKNNVLYVLTADHGIEPIPEILAQKGIPARRIPLTDWIGELNKLISDELSISALIHPKFYPPYLYFNHIVFEQLSQSQKDAAITVIKNYLMEKKGIKKVWSYQELEHASFHHESLEYFFRQQLYPGRSGNIIIQTDPYNQLGSHTTGTDHSTPYRPNTHVPLIIYQPGKYERKTIDQKVWTLQLANTLAHILKVPRPSASTFELLPGIAMGTKGSSDLE